MSIRLTNNADPQSPGFYLSGRDINSLTKAADMTSATLLAGEEEVAEKYRGKIRVTKDWDYFRVAAGTGEQLVAAGHIRLGAILYDTGTTPGTITIRDDDQTGGSSVVHITAASTDLVEGMRLNAGLTVQASITGAGVTILYRVGKFAD